MFENGCKSSVESYKVDDDTDEEKQGGGGDDDDDGTE